MTTTHNPNGLRAPIAEWTHGDLVASMSFEIIKGMTAGRTLESVVFHFPQLCKQWYDALKAKEDQAAFEAAEASRKERQARADKVRAGTSAPAGRVRRKAAASTSAAATAEPAPRGSMAVAAAVASGEVVAQESAKRVMPALGRPAPFKRAARLPVASVAKRPTPVPVKVGAKKPVQNPAFKPAAKRPAKAPAR